MSGSATGGNPEVPWGSSAPVGGSLAATDSLGVARSPVWLLAIVLVLDVVGLALLVFWGLGGAVAAYCCALSAFAIVLFFRRRDTVMRQTTTMVSWPGVSAVVPLLLGLTILVMVVAVWPIATELSRGA